MLVGGVTLGFSGWTLLAILGFAGGLNAVQVITFSEMILIIGVAIWQVKNCWNHPVDRAIATWLGVSVLFGAGPFISLVATPVTFGFAPLSEENIAFAPFLLIYVGLAIGLIRYRLFDLGTWAYSLLLYAFAGIAIVTFDLALVSVLSFSQATALATTFLIVALIWLPARDFIWTKLVKSTRPDQMDVFANVVQSVMQPTSQSRALGWRKLLSDVFDPLEIHSDAHGFSQPHITKEGEHLHMPSVVGHPALTLRHARGGQALFTRQDQNLAQKLTDLVSYAEEQRGAYDLGVSQERARIARDIHDNIGAQLMRALHSDQLPRKDAMIRDTLSDLRDIINNAQSMGLTMEGFFADLRAESSDRLEHHNIALSWQLTWPEDAPLEQVHLHLIRGVVREAISNVIKHANASQVGVAIARGDTSLTLSVIDNGTGWSGAPRTGGLGLENMRARFESLGGQFEQTTGPTGTHLSAFLPISQTEPTHESAMSQEPNL
jgi:signal transduction histidine kinase